MSKETRRQKISQNVAMVIVAAWTVNFVLDIAIKTYDPPGYIQPLMLLAAGWLFSDTVIPKKRDNSKDNNHV